MDWLFDTINWLFYSHGGLNDNSNIKKSRHGKFMYLAKDHTAHKWERLGLYSGCLAAELLGVFTSTHYVQQCEPNRFYL